MSNIIISGATSGIGKAITTELIAAGHHVLGLARDHAKCEFAPQYYTPYVIDFAELTTVEPTVKQLLSDFAEIDALICSAGYGQFAQLEQFSVAQLSRLMTVNFTSQAALIKSVLPTMKTRKSGNIILIGSEAALTGEAQGSVYCASKFALRGFSQSLRKECRRHKIPVSLINPGFVRTEFFDNLAFSPGDEQEAAIDPQHIAELVSLIIKQGPNTVYEEVNIQPVVKTIIKESQRESHRE